MRLYKIKIPEIAHAVIADMVEKGSIEVTPENTSEAELDLVAVMEEYRRRDFALRERVREHMAHRSVPYDQYGKVRGRMAEEWSHPTGDDVDRFLARQFVENFMISRFVDEVFADDRIIYKQILDVLKRFYVDEQAIRDEAKNKIQNISEGTVDYEIALAAAVKEIKRRHGLIR